MLEWNVFRFNLFYRSSGSRWCCRWRSVRWNIAFHWFTTASIVSIRSCFQNIEVGGGFFRLLLSWEDHDLALYAVDLDLTTENVFSTWLWIPKCSDVYESHEK